MPNTAKSQVVANSERRYVRSSSVSAKFIEDQAIIHSVTSTDSRYTQFELSGMVFELRPPPRDIEFAHKITLDAMCLLRKSRGTWKFQQTGEIGSFTLISSYCTGYRYTFRVGDYRSHISACYDSSTGYLDISIPDIRLWSTSGLLWLHDYTYCCRCHSQYPRPWELSTTNLECVRLTED